MYLHIHIYIYIYIYIYICIVSILRISSITGDLGMMQERRKLPMEKCQYLAKCCQYIGE